MSSQLRALGSNATNGGASSSTPARYGSSSGKRRVTSLAVGGPAGQSMRRLSHSPSTGDENVDPKQHALHRVGAAQKMMLKAFVGEVTEAFIAGARDMWPPELRRSIGVGLLEESALKAVLHLVAWFWSKLGHSSKDISVLKGTAIMKMAHLLLSETRASHLSIDELALKARNSMSAIWSVLHKDCRKVLSAMNINILEHVWDTNSEDNPELLTSANICRTTCHKLDVFLRADVNEERARVLDDADEDSEDETDSVTYSIFDAVKSWKKQGKISPGEDNKKGDKYFPSKLFERIAYFAMDRLGKVPTISNLDVPEDARQYLKPYLYEEDVDNESAEGEKRDEVASAREDASDNESTASGKTVRQGLVSGSGNDSDGGGVIDAERGGGADDQSNEDFDF